MAEERKQPELRFKGFTDDWIQDKLGNISSFNPNAELPSQFFYVDLESVCGTQLVDYKFMSKEEAPSRAKRLAKKGDIFYQTVRPYQRNNLLFNEDDNEFVFSTGYAQIRTNIINNKFLFYLLQTDKFVLKVLSMCTGTSYPAITSAEMSKVIIHYPKKQLEQIKIGELLNRLDFIITLEQQKIEKLELLKQYLLQNMFADESGYPRVRFKGYNNKWERSKLNTISDSYSGLSGKTKEDFGKGEARYIEYKNVFDNPVAKLDGTDAIDIDYKQNEVKKGDFLFTTSSETPEEVGMSSLWDYDLNNIYLNSFCFGVRIKEKIDSYYLAYYFRSPEFRSRVMKLAQGISRYNISKNKFCELKISVPSYEEGVRIGRLLKSTTDLIDLEENKLKEFKLIKSKLLQSLFI